jgi:hypothetical protein
MESRSAVMVPFDDRIIFVSSLNRAEFSSGFSEGAQTLYPIPRIQFLAGGGGIDQRRPPGAV